MKDERKWINYLMIGATLSIMAWLGIEESKESSIKKEKTYAIQNISTQKETNTIKQEEEEIAVHEYPKESIVDEYKGYDVTAQLEIPSISLKTYILKNYSTHALNISVTKFWGADANQIGNFCVAGHNFQNKNMFHDLRKLEIGEQLFISDHLIGKIPYEIYRIYKVEPEDVSCLSQETDGNREVTLITCTSNSEKRIIVKARELSND